MFRPIYMEVPKETVSSEIKDEADCNIMDRLEQDEP